MAEFGNQLSALISEYEQVMPDWPRSKNRPSPHTLAVITIYQYCRNLSDREMVDWLRRQPAPGFSLGFSFRHLVITPVDLCEFRQRLFQSDAARQLLNADLKLLKRENRDFHWTAESFNAEDLLEKLCLTTRADNVFEALLQALESISAYEPAWISDIALPHWYAHYKRLSTRLSSPSTAFHEVTFQTMGTDIEYLNQQIIGNNLAHIAALPEITHLKAVWQANYAYFSIGNLKIGQFHWRPQGCSFCRGKGGADS